MPFVLRSVPPLRITGRLPESSSGSSGRASRDHAHVLYRCQTALVSLMLQLDVLSRHAESVMMAVNDELYVSTRRADALCIRVQQLQTSMCQMMTRSSCSSVVKRRKCMICCRLRVMTAIHRRLYAGVTGDLTGDLSRAIRAVKHFSSANVRDADACLGDGDLFLPSTRPAEVQVLHDSVGDYDRAAAVSQFLSVSTSSCCTHTGTIASQPQNGLLADISNGVISCFDCQVCSESHSILIL
ncbi:unnamed protein product [Soboliphyme baturini]|uniref:Uncharacterized protein n=1 Tax=Soboliphyme baturini TaxID=241478 RepID=A0A183IZ04_9BILA|nr:unnamed protein product [Soboliphyme baturini]